MADHLSIVRANYDARKELTAELRSVDELCTTENRAYTDAESQRISEARSNLEAIDARIEENLKAEIRSKEINDGISSMFGAFIDRQDNVTDTRSLGKQFVESDEYRSFMAHGASGNSGAVRFDGVELRAVTDGTVGAVGGGQGNTSAGAFTRPQRLDRVGRDFLDRRVYLTDVLPHIPTTQGAVEYVQDKTPLADLPDAAAETAEQGAKPQGGITTAVVVEGMSAVPVWTQLTRQAAADVPMVSGYLDGRLRYALKRRLDKQVINGNGTSPNIKGLINRSSILTYAPGSAEARYVSIRHSIRLMEDKEAIPEIIVLNPADAELFDLSNSTTAGLHAMDADAGMRENGGRSAWGLTQIRSTAIASGTALLIDPMSVAVFDRQEPTAYMTDSHGGNFTAGILTLLLELRAGLGLFDPNAVLLTTFNGTT